MTERCPWPGMAMLAVAAVCAAAPAAANEGSAWTAARDNADGTKQLETASRTYTKEGAPSVTLVGVAHIGSDGYYKGLQSILDAHESVLYESVHPTGASAPGGTDAAQRVASTRASMLWLRDRIDAAWRADRTPPTIERTAAHAQARDSRSAAWVRAASVDAWGRPLAIIPLEDGFSLVSLGADGRIGGTGEDADLRLRQRSREPARDGDGLQKELASALGLEFQLDRIDYARPGWIVSDMSVDELQAAFRQHGVEDGVIQESLRGGGITADAASTVLTIVRLVDAVSGGSAREAVKVLLVEVLSSEQAMAGKALGAEGVVILDRRNDVVWQDVQQRLAQGGGGTTAVFYGAAHMPDLARRLRDAGWVEGEAIWSTALVADPHKAGLDAATVTQLRDALERSGR